MGLPGTPVGNSQFHSPSLETYSRPLSTPRPYLGEPWSQPRGTSMPSPWVPQLLEGPMPLSWGTQIPALRGLVSALGTPIGATRHGGCGPKALLAPELCLSPCQLPWMGSGEVTTVPTHADHSVRVRRCAEGHQQHVPQSHSGRVAAHHPHGVFPPTSTLLPTYPACPVPLLVPLLLLHHSPCCHSHVPW